MLNQQRLYAFNLEFISSKRLVGLRAALRKSLKSKIISTNVSINNTDRNVNIIQLDNSVNKYIFYSTFMTDIEVTEFIKKIFNFIKENGNTSSECSTSIIIKDKRIQKINKLKLVLNFDEDYVFTIFPNRKASNVCQSIKNITPRTFNSIMDPRFVNSFDVVNGFYYGINMENVYNNEIGYNYFGGPKYITRLEDFNKYFKYINDNLTSALLMNNTFNDIELSEFKKITQKYEYVLHQLDNPDRFKNAYTRINLTVDLENNSKHLKVFWNIFKPVLLNIITQNRIYGECDINYNTEIHKIEIHSCNKVFGSNFNSLNFINVRMRGIFINCVCEDCIINDSIMRNSVVNNSNLNKTYIENTTATNSTFVKTVVNNSDKLSKITGHIESGIIIDTLTEKENLTFNENIELVDDIKKFPYTSETVEIRNINIIKSESFD